MKLKGETEVLVVGAGPVGLLAALSLADRNVDVRIIDKEWRGATHSYALALHPRTLALLDRYGLTADLLAQGHRVERLTVHDGESELGTIDLAKLDAPHRHVLVLPQSALEQALVAKLAEKNVKVFWNHQALGLEQTAEGVRAKVGRMEKYSTGYPVAHTEWMIAKEIPLEARFVVGADGYHSFVRTRLDLSFEHVGPAQTFAVFEFGGRIERPHETRLTFRNGTTNVLWPMGDERGRFSFQVDAQAPGARDVEELRKLAAARAPWFSAPVDEVLWSTTVLFERRLVDRFGQGRVWLAGDAAHITGPIGAQSMNVGLREAHDLAGHMTTVLREFGGLDLLAKYGDDRRGEWESLLGLSGAPRSVGGGAGWTETLRGKILSCMPASGEDLAKLLGQVGLRMG